MFFFGIGVCREAACHYSVTGSGFLKEMKFLEAYHRSMNSLFESYGSYVARRPGVPLLIGLILLGGLCFGLFNVKKEANLENLWVEQGSRIVGEKKFFDSRFGGVPRLEAVTVTPRNSTKDEANMDLAHAFDALKSVIAPLYDNLTMAKTINGKGYTFRENDFCERPIVPDYLKPGTNPVRDGNFLSWGYQKLSTCALKGITTDGLPEGWGIDWLPCIKLSPLDCFKEGGDFDYPLSLQLLERPVNEGLALVDAVFASSGLCSDQLASDFRSILGPTVGNDTVQQLVQGTVGVSQLFFTWGFRWRKSYKTMTRQQIIDHINSALAVGKSADPDPRNPQIKDCIIGQLPCCMTWFGAHSPTLTSLGSVKYDSGGNISKIGGVRWANNNFNQEHPVWKSYITKLFGTSFGDEERERLTKDWENIMISKLDPIRKSMPSTEFAHNESFSDLQVEFNMWRSAEDIISDANKTPIWQIILSVILVSLYAFLAFVDFRDPVHSHTWVALTGLLVVSLAVVAGFGLSAAVGIKLTPLAGSVVPFLTLGLGVDDVFVLVNILRNYLKDPTLENHGSKVPKAEMKLTVALAGPSVVLTTFSVLASFFISSLSPMPIVRWFCWQMGLTATIHTLGMLLIFVPVMSFDARRVKSGICDPYLWPFCGIRRKKATDPVPESFGASDHLTGTSPISRAVAKYYAPLFKSNLFKIIVVILFAALLAVTTFLGFAKVEHGLLLSDITLKGSYQNTFAAVTEDRFLSYQINYVTRDVDIATNQAELLNIYLTIQNNLSYWTPPQPRVLEASALSTIMLYASHLSPPPPMLPVNVSGVPLFTLPPEVFPAVEKGWLGSPLALFLLPDMYCEDVVLKQAADCGNVSNPNTRITATKTSVFAEHLGTETKSNLQMIRQTRGLADNLNAKTGRDIGFFYGYTYLFYEQYLHSYRDLYTVVGFALLGVFIAVLIFQFSVRVSLLIVILLLMIDLEVYGFIYIIGAKLNSLSLVNLGIVIGMAAELTYLARSFLMVDGTRNYRVGKALEWTFEPLLHGFGTQVAATIPLLFLKYHAFRQYYFYMFTVMGVISFLNGFVLLPVLLSWFGPEPLPHVKEEVNTNNGKSISFKRLEEEEASAAAAAP